MPNWCNNTLMIVAPNKYKLTMVCKKLGLKNEIPQVNFGSIVPEPRGPDWTSNGELQASAWFAMPDWYAWRVENWGCKWDVGDIDESCITYDEVEAYDVHRSSDDWITYPRVNVQFDTPWAPPTPFVMALSEKYPDCAILLEFEEGGMCFEGEIVVKAGDVEYQAERDMKPDFDYMLGDLIGKKESA